MIETDLALLPGDPAYDHEAFSGFMEAIRAYVADHPNYDRAEVFPFEVGRTLPIRCERALHCCVSRTWPA